MSDCYAFFNMTYATTSTNDEFSQVFGIERSGRVRCIGFGPYSFKILLESHNKSTPTKHMPQR